MKVCSTCNKAYPETTEYFNKYKAGINGLTARCKFCHRKVVKKYKERKVRERSQEITRMDLAKEKYKLGRLYEVNVKERTGRRLFRGKLIQETDRFITLENKNKIRESFLKIDFYTDTKIKELGK